MNENDTIKNRNWLLLNGKGCFGITSGNYLLFQPKNQKDSVIFLRILNHDQCEPNHNYDISIVWAGIFWESIKVKCNPIYSSRYSLNDYMVKWKDKKWRISEKTNWKVCALCIYLHGRAS